jgi:hypothetical protein
MAVQIQFRNGTAAEWSSANPILAEGEMGIETDTDLFKIGNGVDSWNSLYGIVDGNNTDSSLIRINGGSAKSNFGSADPLDAGFAS